MTIEKKTVRGFNWRRRICAWEENHTSVSFSSAALEMENVQGLSANEIWIYMLYYIEIYYKIMINLYFI